ncbi:MAG TPA: lipid-binding SYLF domain-containing protein [Gammaproteobacteria bacterium]|nr:lipid-binding SYLF domain-containing protein [Gammaproteobacteria bacterium]
MGKTIGSRFKRPFIAVQMLVVAGALLGWSTVRAASSLDRKVETATNVLEQIQSIPEQSIPPALLLHAQGIAVIPSVIKAGFIFGGRHGTGILVVRKADGQWSDPLFVSLTGGSVGWQLGVSSTDVVLVFKNRRGIRHILNGTFTLGVDGAVAAGPVGRQGSADTNGHLNASIYSYSRSRGFFAGVSLEGSAISIDHEDDATFYGGASDQQILGGQAARVPDVARQFVAVADRAATG